MGKKVDLIGRLFGRLTVIAFAENKRSKVGASIIFWKCQCSCGNIIDIRSSSLTHKKRGTKSCGCLNIEQIGKLKRKDFGVAAGNALYLKYRFRAKRKNKEFTLTREEFKLLTSQNCFYCNKEPKQEYRHTNTIGYYTYNGIDRKDNNLGYILENCVPCCGECNSMKMDLNFDFFINKIEIIYNKFKGIK